jgi:purine-nucleoside phosphorylase
MTPHIEAKKEEIASIVIMPGDPLRAKFIAENYLTDYKLVNKVRNMFAYTGFYKDKKVTVMGSGMGMPSMGIYCYELYKFYDVESIIRIGSCGGYAKDSKLFDIILADSAYTEGNFALTFDSTDCHLVESSTDLNEKIVKSSENMNIKLHKGTILTSEGFDFYINLDGMLKRIPSNINVIGAEMEAFALFYTAHKLNKKAACLATIVDKHDEEIQATVEQREKALKDMIELALESVL